MSQNHTKPRKFVFKMMNFAERSMELWTQQKGCTTKCEVTKWVSDVTMKVPLSRHALEQGDVPFRRGIAVAHGVGIEVRFQEKKLDFPF